MICRKSSFPLPFSYNKKASDYLYVDIETTGFKRDRTILYMLGLGYYLKDTLQVIQWFNDDAISESSILSSFLSLLEERPWTLVTFNGESFDLPYLARHLKLSGLPDPLQSYPSVDLYRILRPIRPLFGLPGGRQKDWEDFMGIRRKDSKNGGDLIGVYKAYLKSKESAALDMLFLHNYEDICHLSCLTPLMAFHDLSMGKFTYLDYDFDQRSFPGGQASLTFTCLLDSPFPDQLLSLPLSAGGIKGHRSDAAGEKSEKDLDFLSGLGAARVSKNKLFLTVPVLFASLKHFYPDYKNYYYLVNEDRAVHKSVGRYVQKEYRRACRPGDCYIKKEGLFLPAYNKSLADHFTLYRSDYESHDHYLDLDDLVTGDEACIKEYLAGYLNLLLSDSICTRFSSPPDNGLN